MCILDAIRCPLLNARIKFFFSKMRFKKKPYALPRLRYKHEVVFKLAGCVALTALFILPVNVSSWSSVARESEAFLKTSEKIRHDYEDMLLVQRIAAEKEKQRREHELYVQYINVKYKISPKAANLIVSAVEDAATKYNSSKTLIFSVIAVESRFNPFLISVAGAEGLMQMITKWHPEKMKLIGGTDKVVEVEGSIVSGVMALQEFIASCDGDLVCGLQTYNGNIADKKFVYATKVLTERRSLDQWIKMKQRI